MIPLPAALASTETGGDHSPAFPSNTEIEILVDGAENVIARVTLTVPDTGYEVTDWGNVVHDLERRYVSIEAVRARDPKHREKLQAECCRGCFIGSSESYVMGASKSWM